MDEAFGVLAVDRLPLGVAAKTRVVVEHGKEHHLALLTAGVDELAKPLVEVAMPECLDVTDFVRAPVARNEARLKLVTFGLASALEALLPHEAADGRVAWEFAELGPIVAQGDEVVEDELRRPSRVLAPQSTESPLDRWRGRTMDPSVARNLALEGCYGIGIVASEVVPTLDALYRWSDAAMIERRAPRWRQRAYLTVVVTRAVAR